jgi:hypothetical protein
MSAEGRDPWRDEDGAHFSEDHGQRTVDAAYLDELYAKAERLGRALEALKVVSSAYGDFAGCSAGTSRGALESDHTPSCRQAGAVLAENR